MLLILDSGHCEYVAGKEAPNKSMREWEFNNYMQQRIMGMAKHHGIEVYLTNPSPEKKNEIGLSKRAQLANDYWTKKGKPRALFISLHANAYGNEFNSARGTETFVAKNASSNSKRAAKIMNDEVVRAFRCIDEKAKDRGVKVENFTVIYKAAMPSILVEYGFYTNREDLCVLKCYREELVQATVNAVKLYFGV